MEDTYTYTYACTCTGKKLVPAFSMEDTFHSFAGARAKSSRGDWILERSAADGSFIHAAGIDSPGIAGSPAIALEVVDLVDLLRQAGSYIYVYVYIYVYTYMYIYIYRWSTS